MKNLSELASCPDVSEKVLRRLIRQSSLKEVWLVAEAGNTTAKALAILAESNSVWVRRAVAYNENTPIEVLAFLSLDKDPRVRQAVMSRGVDLIYTVSLLQEHPEVVNLVNLGELDIRVKVNTREELLKLLDLTRQVTVVVEKFLGEELGEFKEIVWRGSYKDLAGKPAKLYTRLALENKLDAISYGLGLEVLARDPAEEVQKAIASYKDTPAAILEILAAQAQTWDLKRMVAWHKNAPPTLLKTLAQEENWKVRYAVAENDNTPKETLELLAADKEELVRQAVAQNRNTSPETLAKLARDSHSWVRYHVAENPNTETRVLGELARDKVTRVSQRALCYLEGRKFSLWPTR